MKKETNFFVKFLIGISGLIVLVLVISVLYRQYSLNSEKRSLEALLEKQKEHVAELENDLSMPREDYIEKYAREVLGYHKAGDLIFKFDP